MALIDIALGLRRFPGGPGVTLSANPTKGKVRNKKVPLAMRNLFLVGVLLIQLENANSVVAQHFAQWLWSKVVQGESVDVLHN